MGRRRPTPAGTSEGAELRQALLAFQKIDSDIWLIDRKRSVAPVLRELRAIG